MNNESATAGIVTFLFTDIEGSTHLWEMHPEAMKSVLRRHDAILRESIQANQGSIVKSTGDGCHAAFESAASAIKASLVVQQALKAEPWGEIGEQGLRVRIGVHSGEAEARAGDYYGTAVNRAARLMSTAYGSQVLVSASTVELAWDGLPDGVTLLDLGNHRLKDLVRPEHIFQLVHPGLPGDFPPLKSLDTYPNNLPIQMTSFIGREEEIRETKRLLSTARLVTLTGSGGTGKTRLSLQAAAEELPSFVDGVWLVELAPVTDPNLLLQTISGVLELQGAPHIPLINLVVDYLRAKYMLLILDNCEHLIDACAELADTLLRACPNLKILASSREGLGITGETLYPVPSLSLPTLEQPTPEHLLASEAAQLFVERATAANPHFRLTESNAAAVAQVCRRLDGIPLAVELAAARIKLFPVEQIAARLNDRFRLLTGGSRTALPRQQTLRAMIDWSYDLLTEPERALMRRLSVFIGGWTFEAADAVCADLDVLSLLEQLVNKSLVVMEDHGGQARYRMLETIRQYARDKLIEAGEGITYRDRHLDYYLRLSEDAEPELRGNLAFEWFDRLVFEEDNIRAAVEWGQDARAEDALLLVGNLIFYWTFRADDRHQPLSWLENLLARVEEQPQEGDNPRRGMRAKARGKTASALLLMSQGDSPAALPVFLDAIELERELGDKFYLAFTLALRSTLAIIAGDIASGRAAAEESVALLRELGVKRWILIGLAAVEGIEIQTGNLTKIEQLHKEIPQYLDIVDHPMFMPGFLRLGMQAGFEGHSEEAKMYFLKGLGIAERVKSKQFTNVMESELAHLARERGDLNQAKDAYRKLIWKWKDFGHIAAVAHQLECFAYIASIEGEPERAARLLGAAKTIRENSHIPMEMHQRQEFEGTLATLHEQIDKDAFESAWAEGEAMDVEGAINYAVTITDDVGEE